MTSVTLPFIVEDDKVLIADSKIDAMYEVKTEILDSGQVVCAGIGVGLPDIEYPPYIMCGGIMYINEAFVKESTL